ncbi:uncharacterized protein Z518_04263 [Rhinocladiella mackenziei CBS 650.93]|uniref:Uncharacterized protein n=1 Tax=Rhinocladiella mackenziei CBS 650.93 TaxID=1442369 RepID=A0A0D2H7A6_9EURO|nr:uncharacterized protein Z518_04263 [Rhinocladiella mackenziei CBS 650.93]KIX06288.1 hypothetical protein Z518_04263 [Rhinocladiella mackenziei CBS 650.93]
MSMGDAYAHASTRQCGGESGAAQGQDISTSDVKPLRQPVPAAPAESLAVTVLIQPERRQILKSRHILQTNLPARPAKLKSPTRSTWYGLPLPLFGEQSQA